ncbi:mitotic cohesin complex kleisin subunit Rad21 [Schizosaccharomyces osmophilus]|uniref:Mitotic cohesin complex kleisin subunit Rad21 n=1 Tax=Schizosaccharomyces osmophilus TaxID=2545709 RepID=A0AAF0AXW3_9SCHI|nr:mitotic cohesin complex kleisin subunit Rad21 [Schizosaccharomyces osmophilus]WBW75137.1 mitotic cohesin complex kleisin subunit Rad21 [Schizosaccharomyces osmophilus]
MFYSEAILSKKGPLAKVWLAAHWEKKLSKVQTLHTDIEQSVHAIVTEETAPMALRLSGQLMLGVVRIYSRKARYLLEDCNEALLRIKMAFRPGQAEQINAPSVTSIKGKDAMAQSANLTLPDTITEFDLLAPDSSFDMQWSQLIQTPKSRSFELHTLPSSSSPSIVSSEQSIEAARNAAPHETNLFSDPLQLNSMDMQFQLPIFQSGAGTPRSEQSIEVGRDAPHDPTGAADLSALVGSQGGKSPASSARSFGTPSLLPVGNNSLDNELLAPVDDLQLDLGLDDLMNDTTVPAQLPVEETNDDEVSHIEIPSDHLDQASSPQEEVQEDVPDITEQQASVSRIPRRQRAVIDPVTELSSRQMKKQLSDTSSITAPLCLNTNPVVLNATVNFMRNGNIQTSLSSSNLNPHLAEIFKMDFLKKLQDDVKKRKLSPTIEEEEDEVTKHRKTDDAPQQEQNLAGEQEASEVYEEHEAEQSPAEMSALDAANMNNDGQVELAAETPSVPPADANIDDDSMIGAPPVMLDDNEWNADNTFNEPASFDSMPSTQVAKDFVQSKWTPRVQGEQASFKELSGNTKRDDAVQLFFDVLVLATKDAISVNQDESSEGDIILTAKQKMLFNSL